VSCMAIRILIGYRSRRGGVAPLPRNAWSAPAARGTKTRPFGGVLAIISGRGDPAGKELPAA